jgi:hypothetical protein
MGIMRWWAGTTRPGLLHRLSGGRGGRAALVLVGSHLGLAAVVALLWFVGLAPVFDGWRWVVAVLASAVYLVGVPWLVTAFGFWGVGVNSGQDGGDQHTDFSPGVAFGLGWLRWALQIVTIGGAFLLLLLIWTDMRWWHLFGDPRVDDLPATAATIPVPQDWTPDGVSEGDRPMGPPQGVYRQDFEVPLDYRYDDLERWFTSADWDGTIGPLRAVECEKDLEDCEAELVPPPGEPASYFVETRFRESSIEGLPPSVTVELHYRSPGADEDPTYGLGAPTG